MTKEIRHVQSGDFVTSEITSAPTKALEERLNALENKIRGITENPTSDINFSAIGVGSNNFILRDKEANSNIQVYDIVYFDKNTTKYEKAQASINTSGSTFSTKDSAFVVGVVIKKTDTNIDILVNGIIEHLSSSQLAGMLQTGESFSQGTVYYLSALEPGKLTKNKPNLIITVLTSGESELFVSKNYTYAEGLESTGTFDAGMRPLGKSLVVDNKTRLVGFPGFEYVGPHWIHTDEVPALRNTGFIIADIDIEKEPGSKNLWLQLELDDDGEVHVILTEGKPDGFIWQNDEVSNMVAGSLATSFLESNDSGDEAELEVITVTNYAQEQTCVLYDGIREIGTFTFKFTAAPGTRRLVIFKIPESFQGWREINTYDDGALKYAIVGSGVHGYNLDYNSFDRPASTAHVYYNSKADFQWPALWPPQPLDNVAFLENGIELLTSPMDKSGDSSTFENSKYIIGVSEKTLYWSSAHRLTQPYDYAHEFYTLKSVDSNDYEDGDSQFPHLTGVSSESYWHWWEDILENESLLNTGKGYANKRNQYFSSSRVMGVSAAGSIEVTDLITGKKADQGESVQGNILISSTSDPDHVSKVTANIDLKPAIPGSSDAVEIFKNETGGDIVVTNIILITTTYQGGALSLNRESTVELALGTSGDVGSSQGLDQNIMSPTSVGISTSDGAAVISGAMMNSKIIRNGDKIWLSVAGASDSSITSQTAKAIVKGVIV
jgi:hypothetical protein